MRMYAAMALAVGLALSTTASRVIGADDLDKLHGSWKMVSAERHGKPLPKEEFDNNVVVKHTKDTGQGHKFVVMRGDVVVAEGTMKHVKSGKPNHYDATFSKGVAKGETVHGIYELDGDTLKVCWSAPGKDRPSEFASAENDGRTVRSYKREK